MSFERAGSMNQIIERSSRLIGAPLAGAMIAGLGATTVLWLDAATFFVSAAIIASLVHAVNKSVQKETRRHWRAELFDGIHFIWKDKLLLTIVMTVMITNLLDTGILMTIYMEQIFNNAFALGLSVAASGGGAVLGALIFAAIGARLPRRVTFIALFILLSLRFFIYALYPPLEIVIFIQFLTGLAAGPINPLLHTVEYERVPIDLRGRVFGAVSAGAMLAMPLGALFTGIFIGQFGLTETLLLTGIIYFITTASLLINRATYQMNNRPPAPDPITSPS